MEAIDHREQVVGSVLLVREDEAAAAERMRGAPVEPAGDVGADPLLAALQHQRAILAGQRLLLFQLLVQVLLRTVERERLIACARVLRTDLKAPAGVVREVVFELLADRALAITKAAHCESCRVFSKSSR